MGKAKGPGVRMKRLASMVGWSHAEEMEPSSKCSCPLPRGRAMWRGRGDRLQLAAEGSPLGTAGCMLSLALGRALHALHERPRARQSMQGGEGAAVDGCR